MASTRHQQVHFAQATMVSQISSFLGEVNITAHDIAAIYMYRLEGRIGHPALGM
jgi:hypothetical protein